MTKRLLLLFAVVLLACCAFADNITPGTTGNVSPTAYTGPYTFLASTGAVSFTGVNVNNVTKFTGRIESSVWRDNASGHVFFTYQFVVDSGVIERLSTTDFTGYLTDFQYSTVYGCATVLCGAGSPYIAASSGSRSVDGSTAGFNFSSGVQAGQETYDMYIFTDASSYTTGSISLIDGGVANVAGFAPTPEPATITLLMGGLAMLGVRRFRK